MTSRDSDMIYGLVWKTLGPNREYRKESEISKGNEAGPQTGQYAAVQGEPCHQD